MADKVVGVQYKVKYDDVVKAEKAVSRHRKALDNWRKAATRTATTTEQAAAATRQATAATQSQTTAVRAAASAQQQAQAVQVQQIQTTARATQTVGLNTKAWTRNIRTMILWGVGAASAYRLFMKVRGAISDSVKALFENTEEYKRLTEANTQFNASLMVAIGNEEAWLRLLDNLAIGIEWFSDALITSRATVAGFFAFFNDRASGMQKTALELAGIWAYIWGDTEAVIEYAQRIEALGEVSNSVYDSMIAYNDAYNAALEEGQRLQGEWTERLTEVEDQIDKVSDAAKRYYSYLEKVQAAEQARIDAIIDLYTEYARKLDDIAKAARRAFEDAAIKGARRREDIETAYIRKLEDIEAAARDRRASAEATYRIKLIQIEMRYREKLIRIEETYRDSFEDAVARRDALALVRARRKRIRDTAAATRQYQNDKTLARLNYEKQLQDQRRNLERMRENARRARDRALEDLRRSLERERADILLSQRRKEEDARLARDRERRDIEDHYTQAIARANAWYTTDETNYGAHLNRKIAQLQNYYRRVIAMYNTYAGQVARPLPLGGTTGRGAYGGTGAVPFAEGGVGLFTSPTTIQVAEGGTPEMVIVQPMTAGAAGMTHSGNFQHQVSGSIDAMMAGWEGRMGVAITQAVQGAMRDVLRA